jgi:hypothetical protein
MLAIYTYTALYTIVSLIFLLCSLMKFRMLHLDRVWYSICHAHLPVPSVLWVFIGSNDTNCYCGWRLYIGMFKRCAMQCQCHDDASLMGDRIRLGRWGGVSYIHTYPFAVANADLEVRSLDLQVACLIKNHGNCFHSWQ